MLTHCLIESYSQMRSLVSLLISVHWTGMVSLVSIMTGNGRKPQHTSVFIKQTLVYISEILRLVDFLKVNLSNPSLGWCILKTSYIVVLPVQLCLLGGSIIWVNDRKSAQPERIINACLESVFYEMTKHFIGARHCTEMNYNCNLQMEGVGFCFFCFGFIMWTFCLFVSLFVYRLDV